ncbi:hypothetical protein HYZ64_02875 [Candidatus Berkelbacteria bacterium]|nr:hypothetical protein [Candidatus Berkelbacteria bacterium]
MIAKTLQQEQAKLLRKQGKSLSKISLELGVSKSSVSVWSSNIVLSNSQVGKLRDRSEAQKLGALANKIKRQKELEKIRSFSAREIEKLQPHDLKRLKDIGTIIYWAEGSKKNCVDITNSDPNLIKVAMLWFRKVCRVPESKFKVSVFYHEGQNEKKMRKYWSEITGVSLEQFHKSIFKKEGTGHRKNILYMGTCKIRICDKNLLCKILTWIEQFHLPE